jgi:hypothetical protein
VNQTPSTSTTSTTPTPQNTCTVTNSLILPTSPSTPAQTDWDGGIVVISAYTTSTTSISQCYLQDDSLLCSFIDEGATASSESSTTSSVLPLNETGTLLMPYYQPGTTTVSTVYNLLVSQDNNYFPVAAVGEIMINKRFAAITLPPSEPSNLNSSSAANAYIFLQNMMAYPTSTLAQQFTAALNQDNTSGNGSCSAVNTFFTGTTSFQNVDFTIYSAVSSYASAYAYIWANFASSYTYNFYTTPPTSSDSSSSTGSTDVKDSQTVTSLGTVVFTRSGSSPAALDETRGGYTISWNPKGGRAVALDFINGQLVATNSDGFSYICLQCTFMDLAQLTGNSADSFTPIQALTGLINGTNAIGSPVDLSETFGAKFSKEENVIESSKTFKTFQILTQIYMGIDIACKLCSWIKEKCARGEEPSSEEIADKQAELQKDAEDNAEDAGNEEPVKTGEDLSESQESAESDALDAESSPSGMNAEAEEAEDSEIEEQFTEEEVQAALEDNSTITDEDDQTNDELDDLYDINPESSNASAEIDSLQDQISSNQATIDSENQSLGDASSAEVQQQDATFEEEQSDEEEDEKEEEEDEDGDGDGDGGDDPLDDLDA